MMLSHCLKIKFILIIKMIVKYKVKKVVKKILDQRFGKNKDKANKKKSVKIMEI
jgi:hypothetical protein